MKYGRCRAFTFWLFLLSNPLASSAGYMSSVNDDTRPPPEQPAEIPIAMTVSGGVSLGAYEAGFLYYHIGQIKQFRHAIDLKSIGGASAGSVNSLLSILTYCQDVSPSPQQSDLYRMWIPLGARQLFDPGRSTTLGLLNRRWIEHASRRIRRAWERGLHPSCDMVWGVATTRVFPRNIALADARLNLPRIEEKFALRIQGRGPNKTPRLTNYADPSYGLEQTLLPTRESGEVDFESLEGLTLASCSFPLAFSPKALPYCITHPESANALLCSEKSAVTGLFLDGGVFDNSPLRLVARMVGAGLRKNAIGKYGWLDAPRLDQFDPPREARFLFVTPDAADYPSYEDPGRTDAPSDAVALVSQLAETFVSTSRTKELYTLLEERPELRHRIFLPRRHFPTASGLMSAFFGFLERDFRIFDFYLGMYDARRDFREEFQVRLKTLFGEAMKEAVYPEEEGMTDLVHASEWAPLRCLESIFDGQASLRANCLGDDLQNFRILAQVALERLYDNCSRLDKSRSENIVNAHCLRASRGEPVPHVPGVVWPDRANSNRFDFENEVEYILRLLSGHQFEFTDLGLGRDEAWRARGKIHRLLETMSSTLVSKQPLRQRVALSIAGEFLTDYIAYAPPKHLFFVAVGRQIEAGYSGSLFGSKWIPEALRLNVSLLGTGLADLFTSDATPLGVGPSIGIEAQPHRLSNRLLQSRFLLRGAALLSSGDGFLLESCARGDDEHFGDCSRLMLEAQAGLVAFDHLRVSLGIQLYPPIREQSRLLWALGPAIGVQF